MTFFYLRAKLLDVTIELSGEKKESDQLWAKCTELEAARASDRDEIDQLQRELNVAEGAKTSVKDELVEYTHTTSDMFKLGSGRLERT